MKVLLFIPSFSSGGAEAFIVNLIEKLDRNKFNLELLCIDSVSGIYDERLRSANVEIQTLVCETIVNPIVRYLKAYKAFAIFVAENNKNYDVIHFNIAQGEELPFIHIAKKCGVPIRILHSHNSSVNSRIKYIGHLICKAVYKKDTTKYLACSDIAAKWLLPANDYKKKNYKIIKNGIDLRRYQYNDNSGKRKREELRLYDKPVFFNIGRLNHQKNQGFLIDTFTKIHQALPNAVLLVAGEGDLRHELEAKTESLGLQDNVRWLGNRNDIPELLSASDVFLLPSLFEGLPYTIIEAQTSGINCVISDTISVECVITDLVERVALDVDLYAEKALSAYEKRNEQRHKYADLVSKAGFDIQKTVFEMEAIYEGKKV